MFSYAEILFEGLLFRCFVLGERTLFGVSTYEMTAPASLVKTQGGLIAHASELVTGNGTQRANGTFNLELRRDEHGTITWQASASVAEPIKGIRVEIIGLQAEKAIIPAGQVLSLQEPVKYAGTFPQGYYPARSSTFTGVAGSHNATVSAQFLLLVGSQGEVQVIRTEEYPPRFQRYWLMTQDGRLALYLYSEANASERQVSYTTPTWRLETTRDISTAISRHKAWMNQAYRLTPLTQRPDAPEWVRQIALNVTFHGHASDDTVLLNFAEMEDRLKVIAKFFDPHKTHVHIVGWDGKWDYTWPSHQPDLLLGGSEGLHQLIATAHDLGYRVGLHMNCMGLGCDHPDYQKLAHFLDHQVRDPQDRPLGWAYDWDCDEIDEEIFAYISPDHAPWRAYLKEQVLNVVQTYQIDNAYLDQTTTQINDRRHNHWRGLGNLIHAIRQELPPEVVISGEGTSEVVANLYPLCGGWPADEPLVIRGLFEDCVRQWDFGFPPEEARSIYPYPWGRP